MAGTVIVKNGLEADRPNVTPGVGEWIYATDSKRTYMGDGSTPGGVSVSRKHFEVPTIGDIQNIEYVSDGDTCDTEDTSDVFMYVNGTWINILASAVVTPVTVEPTLNKGCVNYGSPFSNIRYSKVNNVVYLEGGCSITNGPLNIFTLPAGFRPDGYILSSNYSQRGLIRVDINTAGEVRVYTSSSLSWLHLNIQFLISGG